MHLGLDLQDTGALVDHQPQGLDDIADRGLREEDDRAIDHDVGVGAVEHEEVGEARRGHAQIGPGVAVPDIMQRLAVAADHLHGGEEAAGLEAGAIDQHVAAMFLAIRRHHPAGGDR